MAVFNYPIANQDRTDATALNLTTLDKSFAYLSNIISTLNQNNETKKTVSGYDTILSLLKNAANAPMSLKLDGMTAQNLIVNGDFSDGTTGWSKYYSSFLVSNGVMQDTGDGTNASPFIITNTNVVSSASKKVFSEAFARVTNTSCESLSLVADVVGGASYTLLSISNPTQNTWYSLRGIATLSETSGVVRIRVRHTYADGTTANGKVMEVKGGTNGVRCIDLTAILLESLTATQCSSAFPSYFSGLQSAQSRFRLRSVGKNLFDKDKATDRYVIDSYGAVATNSAGYLTDYIKCIPNTTYCHNRGIATYWNCYDENKNLIITMQGTGITTPFNADSFRTYCLATSKTKDEFQLELGSTATTYEPHRTSTQYFNGTIPLYRVPNGTVNSIDKKTDGSYEEVERNKLHELVAGDVTVLNTASNVNNDLVIIKKNTDYVQYGYDSTSNMIGTLYSPSFKVGSINDDTASIGNLGSNNTTTFKLAVPKGTYANLAAAQAALAGTKLIYQLSVETRTPITTSGQAYSYNSGTGYFEPFTAVAGIYASGISVSATSFPIKALETLSKVDYTTGLETKIDVSTAVIAPNGLSFTHTSLTNGDIVFFTYEFASNVPQAYKTIEYLDSRFVVYNPDDGKYYTWKVAVTGTSPVTASIVPTEVT